MLASLSKLEIVEHALAQYPREACGLLVNICGKPKFRPCKNIAETQTDFIMDPADFIRCEDEGDVLAVVHSHCNVSPLPSEADLVSCEKTGLPWIIVSIPAESWHYFEPSGYKAPLIGRPYAFGTLDCYSLIRDWYEKEQGILLPDFDRTEEWWKKGEDLYLKYYELAGFEKIDASQLDVGDVILMQTSSSVPNHSGIYVGNDMMLHHARNRLSCREIYGGFWRKNTRLVLRFKGLK